MKIYFITTIDPDLNSGGSLVRRGTIKYLKDYGFDVCIVKPGDNLNIGKDKNNTITIPGIVNNRFIYMLEALGIVKDKNFTWIRNVIKVLKSIVKPEDLLFVTTGGSLAPLLIGEQIKKKTKCKFIVNYHDPLIFTTLNNQFGRETRFFHVNWDKLEARLMPQIDYLITSSATYKTLLIKKYPNIASKITCNYFGYIREYKSLTNNVTIHKPINIVYGGNLGPSQSPEILAEAVDGLDNVCAYFVGNYKNNDNLTKYTNHPNIKLIDSMPLDNYYTFLEKNADIGFFSLRNNLSNYCIPSKLYDYINHGLPMLAIVKGDAKEIIEKNEYGLVSDNSPEELREAIVRISDENTLLRFKQNILQDREKWSMSFRINEVIKIILKLYQ